MRIWIDATRSSGLRVFGMTLVERLLHAIRESRVEASEIRVEIADDAPEPDLRADRRLEGLPVRWSRGGGCAGARLKAATSAAGSETWVALPGDAVVDSRLIAHLGRPGPNLVFRGEGGASLLRLRGDTLDVDDGALDLGEVARRALEGGEAEPFATSDFDGYVVKLRRELPAWAVAVRDRRERDAAERFLFWSNYKGSTDFMTRYAYPPLVWVMVRPLTRWRVHPNWVTAVSVTATLAAIPLFASGAWLAGFGCAYLMSVLDSVDGKLARLTFRSSRLGNLLDHGLDLVHPPFWYLAWGFALASGDPAAPPFVAAVWLFALYVLDRIAAPVFKNRTGRSIHGYTALDERMRTFISRRNVNLPLFTAAVGLDALLPRLALAGPTFYVIVGWQLACLVFHWERVVRFWSRGAQRRALGQREEALA